VRSKPWNIILKYGIKKIDFDHFIVIYNDTHEQNLQFYCQ